MEFNPFRFFFQAIAILFGGIFFLLGALFEWMGDLFRSKPTPLPPLYDESKLKIQNTSTLAEEVNLLTKAAEFPDKETFIKTYSRRLKAAIEKAGFPVKSLDTIIPLLTAAMDIYEQEQFSITSSPLTHVIEGSIEAARMNDILIARKKKLADPEHTIAAFCAIIDGALLPLAMWLPKHLHLEDHDETSVMVSLYDLLPEPKKRIEEVAATFRTIPPPLTELGLFQNLLKQFDQNEQSERPILENTPLADIFTYQIPFKIPLSKQLEHSMIAAGSRYGKSQLIGSIIATHLNSKTPPGIIVIDSTGDFTEKLSHLALFAPTQPLDGRLLVIDPADAPQLNMFDLSAIRAKGYGTNELEQVEADIINMFNYVFASIGSELTAQQGTGFNFLVRLLLSIPGSNITTFREILEIPAKSYNDVPSHVKQAIEKLDPTTQAYFRNQFFTLNMLSTRQGVARRLYGILQIPTFERMFSGGNRIDFFQAMQDGKIIVVNTAKSMLQPAASALFGRYIIARVMSGAFERTVIKDINQRRPCLLFIDEAQEYFDGTIDTLLTQIGKFKLGICLAFQYFGQMDDKLRASILGNTTVKYAGGLNASESRMIARELRVDDDFVMAQRKDPSDPPQWAEFATHVKYSTDHALSLTVPFYALENMPKMSDEAHRAVMLANRDTVAGPQPRPTPRHEPPPPPSHRPEPSPSPPQKRVDDAASEWQ